MSVVCFVLETLFQLFFLLHKCLLMIAKWLNGVTFIIFDVFHDITSCKCTIYSAFGKTNYDYLIESSQDHLTALSSAEKEGLEQIFINRLNWLELHLIVLKLSTSFILQHLVCFIASMMLLK